MRPSSLQAPQAALVVRVDALQERQEDLTEERKGPPTAQALKDGARPCRDRIRQRCGVDPADLNVRETPKGPCVFATVCTPGQSSQTLLQEMILAWIDGLQGSRFMRWGRARSGSADRFVGCWPCRVLI